MSTLVLCARCQVVPIITRLKFCVDCKAAIIAEARILVARWPTEEGRCRLCGWRYAAPGQGTHVKHQMYCGDEHYHIFGIARMLAQSSSFGMWLDAQYQAWLSSPHDETLTDLPFPPAPLIIPPATQRQERDQAALAAGVKTCAGWQATHEPMELPLIFFAQIGDTHCKICKQAYHKLHGAAQRDQDNTRRREQYRQHRDEALRRARENYEAGYMERLAQRQARIDQVMSVKVEQQQQQVKCAHGFCTTPDQCGQQCASLKAHLQKNANAVQRAFHALAAQGFHPSNHVAVGYRGVEVPQTYRPSGVKRAGNKPRYAVKLIKDEEVAERISLAWDLRLNGASYGEIHQRCFIYDVRPDRKRSFSSYHAFFANPLYTGIFRYGGIWYPLDWESGARFCDPYVTLDDYYELERRRATSNPFQ